MTANTRIRQNLRMDRLARQICDRQCSIGVNASFMPCCG